MFIEFRVEFEFEFELRNLRGRWFQYFAVVTENVHPPCLTLLKLGGKIVHLALYEYF